jgi:nitroreductase
MDFSEMLHRRRAANFFDTGRELPEETLRRLVEMAALAPSSFNLQPWNLIVLRDPADKARLRKLAWDQPKITEAPVVCIVLADKSGGAPGNPVYERNWAEMVATGKMTEDKRAWFEQATASLYGRSPEAATAFAVKNTAFFAMALMLSATSLGLDSHPMDGFDHDAVLAEFKIPDNYFVPLLLALGWLRPGVTLAPPKWRKSFEEITRRFD